VYQAMLGLQHIHERGMIHRNLEPGNLMLVNSPGFGESDRAVKILDIGLGKAVFTEGEKSTVDDPSQLTTDGVLIGTPDYLAPEQARSARTADIRADIYSLGCVLYHALTGQPPFPDKSVLNTVMRHATEPPRPLSDFLPEVPDGLQNVMNWLLAKDPAQRYATPERAAQALNLFLLNTPPSRPTPPPTPAYVRWLETSPDADPGRPAPPPGNIPIGKLEPIGRRTEPPRPSKPPTATAPALPPTATASSAPPAVPVAAPAAQGFVLANFDVELVSVPLPGKVEDEPRGLLELDRRDAIMLISGGVLVALAVLLGWGLNKALRREPPPESSQPQPVVPGNTEG
jgi:serine/threonine protein kinase